jgi:hypothetical protein
MSLDLYLECHHCKTTLEDWNYTYNVSPMWFEAMKSLNPDHEGKMIEIEELTGAKAVLVVEKGLKALKADPEKYRALDPENGWGSYDEFVEHIPKLIEACEKHPDAVWRAWR